MTGPEHYREAERLLRQAANSNDPSGPSTAVWAARAQVHATLAQTAALVDATNEGVSELDEWRRAQGGDQVFLAAQEIDRVTSPHRDGHIW